MYTLYNNYSFASNEITSTGASILFEFLLQKGIAIQFLNLQSNKLDDNCMKSLGELISSSDSISYVGLRNNGITDEGIKFLAIAMVGNTSLRYLDVTETQITDASAPYLAEMIDKSHISQLDMFYTSVSSKTELDLKRLLERSFEERDAAAINSKSKSAAKSQTS